MKNLSEEKRWFGFYHILPTIVAVLQIIVFGLSALGVLFSGMRNSFGSFLLIVVIGAIVTGITYAIMKISISPMILQVEYLEIIARNTTNKTNTTNATLNSQSPSMLEQALVKHSNGVKTAKMSEDEIIKKLTTLKDLYDQGILSEETYEKRKKEILDNNKKPEVKTIQER